MPSLSALTRPLSKLKKSSTSEPSTPTSSGSATPKNGIKRDDSIPRSSIDRVRNSLDGVSGSKGKGSKPASKRSSLNLNFRIPKVSSSSSSEIGEDGVRRSKSSARRDVKKESKYIRERLNAKAQKEIEMRKKEEDEKAMREEPPEIRARYGNLPLIQSTQRRQSGWTEMADLSSAMIGQEITFRARLHTIRRMGPKLVFFVFRGQVITIQGVMTEREGAITEHMVKWAEHIRIDAIVQVKGLVKAPKEEVKGASIKDAEIQVEALHIISEPTEPLAFTVYESELDQCRGDVEAAAAKSEEENQKAEACNKHHISERTRLNNRIVDLRSPASQSIFRINSGVCQLFRSFLDGQGFIEIHTPKLQGGATESGASVFQVNYFGRPAFLAQSPQLAKQMAIAADLGRVFEIGPVFRAENSNTHRHLTEYTGLDLEMSIDEHYHEALDLIDTLLKTMFKGIYSRYRKEVDIVKRQFPHEDMVVLDETPRIPFQEGIRILTESGWRDEDGKPLSEYEDLGTRDEIQLGKLIKEKYGCDYYILDRFPASARPFYTMPDPKDPKYTNSFDIFIRGQEIISGGQRIHDPRMLEEQMLRMDVDPNSMEEYMEGFRWGAPPHAGCGMGLERIVMLMLNLGNVRLASLFYRDPKSLPKKPPVFELRHPEASTLHPPWEDDEEAIGEKEFQPLEKLIANYGDASNTSWLDDRYQVWRHEDTGAAVGYVKSHGFAVIVGDPLCEKAQYAMVIRAFLKYVKKELKLDPIWLLVGKNVENVLGVKFGWRAITCTAENRVNPVENKANLDPDVQRKIRHAQREGVKIIDVPKEEGVSEEIKKKCDQRMADWLAGRKGTQMHLTELNPWRDPDHRRYFYAQDKEGKICALVVMAQLSPEHGWQIKYALDFPGAPNGAIEHITLHAMAAIAKIGVTSVTFGGGALPQLTAEHAGHGITVKFLEHAYETIVKNLKLTQKTEFREKLGAEEDPVYICYPPHGLGPRGVYAIMSFFQGGEE